MQNELVIDVGDIVEINYDGQRFNVLRIEGNNAIVVRYACDEETSVPISSILKQWKLQYQKPPILNQLKVSI